MAYEFVVELGWTVAPESRLPVRRGGEKYFIPVTDLRESEVAEISAAIEELAKQFQLATQKAKKEA